MVAKNVLAAIEDLKGQARVKYKVEIRGLFGSFVRNEQTTESDIDVLVEFKSGADFLDLVGLSQFLEERLNRKVDVVPLNSLREEIKDDVLREVLYI